jgi:hypothetical protein
MIIEGAGKEFQKYKNPADRKSILWRIIGEFIKEHLTASGSVRKAADSGEMTFGCRFPPEFFLRR